jgi:regulatory protein
VKDARARRASGRARPPRTLKARAIGFLARRDYARAELRAKLLALADGPSRDEVDALLDELAALGYLSDSRFAHAVVRQKAGGWSRRAIAGTLKAKGVTGDDAAAALAGHDVDDDAALVALWRRRFGRPPADAREEARQVRFLQSRGFSLTAIFKLLRHPPPSDDEGPALGT